MSLTYKKIKNNTENSIIVNGTYIGPLSETTMSSDIIDLIDKQYFTAGILTDLGKTDVGNSTIVIDTQTIQFYKKPALGIPKSHLDKEIVSNLEKAARSVQKGQVSVDDLNEKLRNIVESVANDVNGDKINDKTNSNFNIGQNSVVIKEKQLDKSIKEALSLARTSYQKAEDGIYLSDLSEEVLTTIGEYKSWKNPVQSKDELPVLDNRDGDAIIVLDPIGIYIWRELSNSWIQLNLSSGSPDSSDDDTQDEPAIIQNPFISKTILEESFAIDGQTIFTTSQPYSKGTNQLEVYLNGILVLNNVDYIEKDNTTIQFLYPLEEDDYVLASINAGFSGAIHHIENINIEEKSNKRVIRSSHAFNPDGLSLRVFLNGMMVEFGEESDYLELDHNHIKFNYDLEEGDRLTLRIENSGPNENILNQLATFRKAYSTLSKQVDLIKNKVDQMK